MQKALGHVIRLAIERGALLDPYHMSSFVLAWRSDTASQGFLVCVLHQPGRHTAAAEIAPLARRALDV